MKSMRELINMMEDRTTVYPSRLFWLPTAVLDFYDTPEGAGDDGYTVDQLVVEISRDGQIMEVLVGFSKHEIEHNNNHTVCVFNGNHRLAACRKLGITEMLCDNSSSHDAQPITLDQLHQLGGRMI